MMVQSNKNVFSLYETEQLKSYQKQDERVMGMTCSKGPQVGFEPWAAAARTQLNPVSHRGSQ